MTNLLNTFALLPLSRRYHFHDGLSVCPFICLFVCLFAGLRKYYWLHLPEKILTWILLKLRFKLKFESDLNHCLDTKKNADFPICYYKIHDVN